MLVNLVVLVATLFALASAGIGGLKTDPLLTVSTTLGQVVGHYNEVGVREWKGIPYAQPPVGDLRWEYPAISKPYNGAYEANFDAPGCPQVFTRLVAISTVYPLIVPVL